MAQRDSMAQRNEAICLPSAHTLDEWMDRTG
jgi:hypothetical protein